MMTQEGILLRGLHVLLLLLTSLLAHRRGTKDNNCAKKDIALGREREREREAGPAVCRLFGQGPRTAAAAAAAVPQDLFMSVRRPSIYRLAAAAAPLALVGRRAAPNAAEPD